MNEQEFFAIRNISSGKFFNAQLGMDCSFTGATLWGWRETAEAYLTKGYEIVVISIRKA